MSNYNEDGVYDREDAWYDELEDNILWALEHGEYEYEEEEEEEEDADDDEEW